MTAKEPSNPTRFAIQTNKHLVIFDASEVMYCLADGNYSHIYFANRPKEIISKQLKSIAEEFPTADFFRIHQSHLVNINYVVGLVKNVVLLQNGEELSIAKGRRADFLKCFRRI